MNWSKSPKGQYSKAKYKNSSSWKQPWNLIIPRNINVITLIFVTIMLKNKSFNKYFRLFTKIYDSLFANSL